MIGDFGGDRGAWGGALDGIMQVHLMFQNPVYFSVVVSLPGGFRFARNEFRKQGF